MSGLVRAVLFDLDGVLVDSWPVWLAVVDEAARVLDRPPVGAERLRAHWGQGLEDDVRHFYPGRTVDEVRAAFAAALPTHVDRIAVDPEARALLEALAARGIARAVTTNTQDDLAVKVVAAAGLHEHLDAIEAIVPGRREKPAPDVLLAALDALQVEAADALMVGDTDYDAQAARAARVRFLPHRIGKDGSLLARVLAAVAT